MKKILLVSLLTLPFICMAQYTYKNLNVNYLETNDVAKNYTYENLRLYPVYAKESFKTEFKNIGKYMTLQDALSKNKIKITEKSNGGTVNTLVVENVSSDTIIIITGDVIKGGKQDRIINKDALLNPKSGKKDLPVYCVESGRWSERSSATGRPGVAEFKQYENKGSMSLRKVVEKEKDQGKVWSKVEELNKANNTTTDTKTYTAITSSSDYNKKLEKYIQFFKNKFIADSSIIGVIVVSSDKVLGCDMFATHQLFSMQFESLLHSYATEAILKGKPVVVVPKTVKDYMNKLLVDEKTQDITVKEKGNAFTDKNKKLRVSVFD